MTIFRQRPSELPEPEGESNPSPARKKEEGRSIPASVPPETSPQGASRLREPRSNRAYSLKEAASATGIPEARIRRAILLEDLVAEPVPDDREYLIEGRILERFVDALRPAAEKPPGSGRHEVFDHLGGNDSGWMVAALLIALFLIMLAMLYGTGAPGTSGQKGSPDAVPPGRSAPTLTVPPEGSHP